MDIEAVIQEFRQDPQIARNIVEWRTIPARDAVYEPFPENLDPRVAEALRKRGITQLYSHQAESIRQVMRGEHTAVVTGTASGKTVCYNVPVMNALAGDDSTRALYLFPTKALAQDQYASLHSLIEAAGIDIKTHTYDGDTPANIRRVIRHAGHIVMTNPDMLHSGILPHHTRWHNLFENLQFVVIDEMHGYRGVFGSHMANVIRRLKRVCRHYGSDPVFIFASATIANPGELAESLIEDTVSVVDQDGAPHGRREIVFYNPPVVNQQLGIRRSVLLESRRIASFLLERGVHTIVFARARTTAEVMLTYLRESLPTDLAGNNAVRGYRGGYLPGQRREIERGLRDGTVRGVVSTNALELGVDIGSLDACVMVGYPGTIASSLQQAGRAGRRDTPSLSVMVGSSAPMDQFIMSNPDYFFERKPEHGLINPDNLLVLLDHVKCAAFELPFRDGDTFGREQPTELLEYLADHQVVLHSGDTWFWTEQTYPAEEISLRTAARDNVVIINQADRAKPVVVGEIDTFAAPMLVHTEAIYIHEGQQYHVDRLDWDEKKAYIHPVNVDYYTDASLSVRVQVMDQFSDGPAHAERHHGEVLIGAIVTMFKKIKLHTHENVGWGKVHLPEQQMHTTSYWMSLPQSSTGSLREPELEGAVIGLSNLLRNVTPIYLMCDPRDIGVYPQVRSPHTGRSTIFLYDLVPGGVGFSEKLFDLHVDLLQACRDLVGNCSCESGCPSCVGPIDEVGERARENTRGVLDSMLSGHKADAVAD
ncbi:MAG: DEAD/DEAH box helicase [Sphaerobacteraceae bacterium]|nr:MAG: DEAD/DEAH box helicase [Sphaerobacteraceae bacterium]